MIPLPPIRTFTEAERQHITGQIRGNVKDMTGTDVADMPEFMQDHLLVVEQLVLESVAPILGRLPELNTTGMSDSNFLNDCGMAAWLVAAILQSARESIDIGLGRKI